MHMKVVDQPVISLNDRRREEKWHDGHQPPPTSVEQLKEAQKVGSSSDPSKQSCTPLQKKELEIRKDGAHILPDGQVIWKRGRKTVG